MPKKQKKDKKYSNYDEVLKDWLDKKDKEIKKHIDYNWWWASELGMCNRKQFLRRMKLKPSEEKESRIKFLGQDGKASHRWRENAAEEMGVVIEREKKIRDKDYCYSGRCDLLIKLDDKLALIDIKTQRPEAFFRRKRLPVGKKIKDFQKTQLASYVYFLKKHSYPDLSEGRLYFVDRGGGLRDEYIFHFTKKDFKKVQKILNNLNKHWKKKKIPEKEKTWLCNYCEYKSICKKVEKNKLTFDQIKKKFGQK